MKPDLRRCLTLKQPWAWLMIRPDLPAGSPERLAWLESPERKGIENRGWKTSYRGTLYIHAGKAFDLAGYRGVQLAFPQIPLPPVAAFKPGTGELSGGIIGRVRFVGIVSAHPSPWFFGPFGWIVENPEPLPFEPLTGAMGLFCAGDTKPPAPAPTVIMDELIPSRPCPDCQATGSQMEMDPEGPTQIQCPACKGLGHRLNPPTP